MSVMNDEALGRSAVSWIVRECKGWILGWNGTHLQEHELSYMTLKMILYHSCKYAFYTVRELTKQKLPLLVSQSSVLYHEDEELSLLC
eukprot:scaffold13119_cov141-Skeletonema_dohrnii-CCMP3373.AAC.5